MACANSETGYVQADATAISRLRKAIDKALRNGKASALIETGLAQEYHLTISRDDVTVNNSFFELVRLKVVTELQATEVRALFRIVQSL